MKKRLLRAVTVLCAMMLLFMTLPLTASGAGGEVPLKIKGTDVTEMKFMRLTNRGDMPPRRYTHPLGYYTTYIVLEGKKVATGVGSMDDGWDFTLYVNFYAFQDKIGLEPTFKFTESRITHELVNGTEKGVLVYYTGEPGSDDPEEQAAAEQKNKNDTKDEIRKVAGMPKDEALSEMEAAPVPIAQTVYLADFTITGNGTLGVDSHDGKLSSPGGSTVSEMDKPQFAGKLIYNVALKVDDFGYATAVITLTDALGHPHKWTLEGYMGAEQPQKPKKPPKPKPKEDDPLAPDKWPEIWPPEDDLAPVNPKP